MKKIKEYSGLIIFVIIIFLDYRYKFLKTYIDDGSIVELIRVLGVLLFAKTTDTSLKTSLFAKEETYDYTDAQEKAIDEATVILNNQGVELVGTRPTDR